MGENFANHSINKALTAEAKVVAFSQMARIRALELKLLMHFNLGNIAGWLCVQIGQESIAVAVRSLMGSEDQSISHHRGLGHALVAGVSMQAIAAELMGKPSGIAKGKAGHFSMISPQHRHWGSTCLAGSQTSLACGLALALKYRQQRGAAFCFLGDGAMSQGVVHEAFNLANLMKLPVIFVLENNQYSMGTSVKRSSALRPGGYLAQRAEGYGMAWDRCDTDDFYEIRARLAPLIEAAYDQHQPALIEIPTYRYYGFTMTDAKHKTGYRTEQEIEHWRSKDALAKFRSSLISEGLLTATDATEIETKSDHEAATACDLAAKEDFPESTAILDEVYAQSTPGRLIFGENSAKAPSNKPAKLNTPAKG